MTIEELIKTAELLPEVGEKALDDYESNYEKLIAEVNSIMLARPDINKLIGEVNIEMMRNNSSNHTRFVLSILTTPNAQQLVETVAWVFRSYMSRGFHANFYPAFLDSWISVLRSTLDEESFNQIYPLYNWFIINIPSFTDLVAKKDQK